MNLDPAPRLPKWIFFAVDAGLLLAASVIVYFNRENPYAPLPFISAVGCVALAGIISLIPFLIDYAADSAEYVKEERDRVSEQVQRLHATMESLTRASSQIKAVEEAVHKTAHAAENLPYRMQEKLAEFNAALAEKESGEQEAIEQELTELRAINSDQLKNVAEKIQQAVRDWTALDASRRQQLAAAEAALAKLNQATQDAAQRFETKLQAALATLDAKLAAAPRARNLSATPAPQREAELPLLELDVHAVAPAIAHPVSEIASAPAESIAPAHTVSEPEPKPKKTPRPVRKEEPASSPAPSSSGVPAAAIATPGKTSSDDLLLSDDFIQHTSSGMTVESSVSSDGATRLLATAYIGIGNKLFIRGDGPGLSWDVGLPMQFVSIGKWGWSAHDVAGPVRCALYKNDDTPALTGEVVVEPGKHVEVTALF